MTYSNQNPKLEELRQHSPTVRMLLFWRILQRDCSRIVASIWIPVLCAIVMASITASKSLKWWNPLAWLATFHAIRQTTQPTYCKLWIICPRLNVHCPVRPQSRGCAQLMQTLHCPISRVYLASFQWSRACNVCQRAIRKDKYKTVFLAKMSGLESTLPYNLILE